MLIYCCSCKQEAKARLTNGKEIYPHRRDLAKQPFWKCDTCGNYVGCHHKTKNATAPLGVIPTPEMRTLRKQIHGFLDPMWKMGRKSRNEIYAALSEKLGWRYHTAKIRSVEEAEQVLTIVKKMAGVS